MESASPLKAWTDFYVIVGSSAAALTGLMFVVITLVAGVRARTRREGIAAFSTPTVVHFCSVLFIAAVISAPWPTPKSAAVVLAIASVGALVYAIVVGMHAVDPIPSEYEPDFSDLLSYSILPVVLYVAALLAALALVAWPAAALFGLAGVSLALVFLGIHNAWDVVTYVASGKLLEDDGKDDVGTS